MRKLLKAGSAAGALVLATAIAGGCSNSAPSGEAGVPRTTWDKKPNLMGVWEGKPLTAEQYRLAELMSLYQLAAREKMAALTKADDPVDACIPYGSPRHQALGLALEIVHAPEGVAILSDKPHMFRYIPTDGRPHLEDVFPTNLGSPVGRWDGDTLVIDVISFIGRIWLAGGAQTLSGGPAGWPTSESLHVVERWRLVDRDKLEYQATVEDSVLLTAPWTTPPITYTRSSAEQIGEGICIPSGFDFEPPAAPRTE